MLLSAPFLAAAVITFGLDRVSKRVVEAARVRGRRAWLWQWGTRPLGVVRCITRFPRRSSAWELATLGVLLTVIAALGAAGAFPSPISHAGLGAAVAGAVGNASDRARSGTVVDFVAVGWWPPFNAADVGIVVGVFAALAG
jgi:lipoprotein signal peptidase